MKRSFITTSVLTVFCSILVAAEHTVTIEDFEKKVTLEGVLLPEEVKTLRIEPTTWETFPVEKALSQGAAVEKGTVIVQCDHEALDLKISEEDAAKKVRELDLEVARLELADFKINAPRQLAAAERTFRRAKEDLEYFEKTGRPVKEQAAELLVDRARRQLEYQTEELEQLLKMYAEDDLTEETEEIILKRQRSAVKDAKMYLERSIISKKKTMETDLPRELVDLTEKFETAELALATKKESLPRALAKKELAVEKMEVAHELADKSLGELREDRSLMTISSPVKGHLYFGEMADGRWSVGQSAKILKRGGKVPKHVNFACIVPMGAMLRVESAVAEAQILGLEAGQEGYFSPLSSPRQRMKGKIVSVATYPDLAGTYPLVFELSGATDGLVAGMKGKITVISKSVKDAISIPLAALHEEGDGGFSVEVKVGDEGQKRSVILGAETKDMVIIREGLEAGDVVIVGKAEKTE